MTHKNTKVTHSFYPLQSAFLKHWQGHNETLWWYYYHQIDTEKEKAHTYISTWRCNGNKLSVCNWSKWQLIKFVVHSISNVHHSSSSCMMAMMMWYCWCVAGGGNNHQIHFVATVDAFHAVFCWLCAFLQHFILLFIAFSRFLCKHFMHGDNLFDIFSFFFSQLDLSAQHKCIAPMKNDGNKSKIVHVFFLNATTPTKNRIWQLHLAKKLYTKLRSGRHDKSQIFTTINVTQWRLQGFS